MLHLPFVTYCPNIGSTNYNGSINLVMVVIVSLTTTEP